MKKNLQGEDYTVIGRVSAIMDIDNFLEHSQIIKSANTFAFVFQYFNYIYHSFYMLCFDVNIIQRMDFIYIIVKWNQIRKQKRCSV